MKKGRKQGLGDHAYLVALTAIVIAGLTTITVVTLTRAHDNTTTTVLASVAALLTPVIAGLLAMVVRKVENLQQEVDGRLTQLVEAVRSGALAEGRQEGIASQRAERGEFGDEEKPEGDT